MSNAIIQTTSHGSNGLLFVGWNQDQSEDDSLAVFLSPAGSARGTRNYAGCPVLNAYKQSLYSCHETCRRGLFLPLWRRTSREACACSRQSDYTHVGLYMYYYAMFVYIYADPDGANHPSSDAIDYGTF